MSNTLNVIDDEQEFMTSSKTTYCDTFQMIKSLSMKLRTRKSMSMNGIL